MRLWYPNALRILIHPYLFFEETIEKNNPIPATIIFLFSWIMNFQGWHLINTGISGGLHLSSGMLVSLFIYPIAVITLYLICRVLVRETRLSSFFTVWGFSYLPNLLFTIGNILIHLFQKCDWFITVTTNPLFLIGFWAFILLMLLWKILLLAITLRLAGNLNLSQILKAITILLLLVWIYWWGGLILEWFKVPFI